MTSPFLVTSADTRPLEVLSQLTSSFLSSSPTWSFTTKRTILYTWLSWQCHLKITSRKLTIVTLRNIETLFLIFWIMDSPVIWRVLKLDYVALFPLKTSGTLREELSKVALLTSYTIWNARQELGSENQPLLSAWVSFHLGVALSFAGFISEFLEEVAQLAKLQTLHLEQDTPGLKSPVGLYKNVEALQFFFFFFFFFFHVFKTLLLYHKEKVKCWPGWYFICLLIYLTAIDASFISNTFIDSAIFSIQWVKSGVAVPTDQVPGKTIVISNLHCALHMHMLKNAISVLSLELGIIRYLGRSLHFFKGKFSEDFFTRINLEPSFSNIFSKNSHENRMFLRFFT